MKTTTTTTRAQALRMGLILLASIGVARGQNQLPRDEEGWTIFTPSGDTRILYVSSSEGNDASAQIYTRRSPASHADPFHPARKVKAFRTIGAAMKAARENAPDWILLKRGDSFGGTIQPHSGRSVKEPSLIAPYGSNPTRPIIDNAENPPLLINPRGFHHVAVVGLHFYTRTRDPNSPKFVSNKGADSIVALSQGARGEGLLIEDCCFQFNLLQIQAVEGGIVGNVTLRRNLFLDSYSTGGHSQGIYVRNVPMLIEENVFDHNGWCENPNVESGRATMFNHNAYFEVAHDILFRGNMVFRASSMGIKFRADNPHDGRNVIVDDNLFVEGEIGLSIGGNGNAPDRFENVLVANNVLAHIGRARPTNRTLSWAIDMQDWNHGAVMNNLVLSQNDPRLDSAYAIHMSGLVRDVSILQNTIYDLRTKLAQIQLEEVKKLDGVVLAGNRIFAPIDGVPILQAARSATALTLKDNTYFSPAKPNLWFQFARQGVNFSEWAAATGEVGSKAQDPHFPDPDRTLESYNKLVGGEPTFADFISQVRKQSKTRWRREYTAAAVNNYLREGFGMKRIEVVVQEPSGVESRGISGASRIDQTPATGKTSARNANGANSPAKSRRATNPPSTGRTVRRDR